MPFTLSIRAYSILLTVTLKFQSDSLPYLSLVLRLALAIQSVFSLFSMPCDFSPDRFQEYVFINHICVAREHQRKGIATAMLNYLCETYNKDIKLNCFKHTQAETSWEHIGTRDNSKYNSRINTYIVRKNDLQKTSFL